MNNEKIIEELILAMLEDKDRDVRGAAIDALSGIDKANERIVAALSLALHDKATVIRMKAVALLGRIARANMNE